MSTDRRTEARILRGVASVEVAGDTVRSEQFVPEELQAAGGRIASLAGRLAAKQACMTLFPHEAAAGTIGPLDFVITTDGYGAPHLRENRKVRQLLDRYRLRTIALSLTHDAATASAVAVAERLPTHVPVIGKVMYYVLPFRRRVLLKNLHRVFGGRIAEPEIVRVAQAHYAYYVRLIIEFFRYPRLRPSRRATMVRVENGDALMHAVLEAKGVIIVTAHLGSWEVACVGGMEQFPQLRGRFHMLRRKLWPRLLYGVMANRLRQAGIGVLFKKGTLDRVLDRLRAAEVVVCVLDQHAGGRDGVEVDFFGQPASVFRSPAVIARSTGALVVPATSWREPDGRHVIRFEEALPFIQSDDPDECIRLNTRAYIAEIERFILRHPEQWGMWMHRMWKRGPSEVTKPLTRRVVERVLKLSGAAG